jgi:hypothetical protein
MPAMRGVGLVLAVTATACAAGRSPTHQLGRSQAAVRVAEELHADGNPQAALHLKMARDHISRAERLIAQDEPDAAWLTLIRAEADAELAVAMAREADERARADAAVRKVQVLRRELE